MKIKRHAETMWMKEELEYLYKKKAKLNRDLYMTHLKLLDSIHVALLDNVIQIINKYIHDILQRVYQKQKIKLQALKHRQIKAVSYTHLDVYKRQNYGFCPSDGARNLTLFY